MFLVKRVPALIPAEFTIYTTQAGYGDLEVQVLVIVLEFVLKDIKFS